LAYLAYCLYVGFLGLALDGFDLMDERTIGWILLLQKDEGRAHGSCHFIAQSRYFQIREERTNLQWHASHSHFPNSSFHWHFLYIRIRSTTHSFLPNAYGTARYSFTKKEKQSRTSREKGNGTKNGRITVFHFSDFPMIRYER